MAAGIAAAFWLVGKAISFSAGATLVIAKSEVILESSVLALKKLEETDLALLAKPIRKAIENDNSIFVGIKLNASELKTPIIDFINQSPLSVEILKLDEAKNILKDPKTLYEFDFIIVGDKNDVNDIQNHLRNDVSESKAIQGNSPVNTNLGKAYRKIRQISARFK